MKEINETTNYNKKHFNSGIQVKNACVFVIGSSRNVTEAGSVGG